jgi:isocitrate dehydrogenase kinase/phosphatase
MDGITRQFSNAPSCSSTSSHNNSSRDNGILYTSENHNIYTISSQHVSSGSSTTPPHFTQKACASAKILSDYVTREEHERVVRDNHRLSKELDEAKGEASEAKSEVELAKYAFRMLAGWAYIERQRLPKETLEMMNGVNTMDVQWLRHDSRMLAGLQQVKAVQDSRVEEGVVVNSVQGDAPDAEVTSSIADQVDQLIAEENSKIQA